MSLPLLDTFTANKKTNSLFSESLPSLPLLDATTIACPRHHCRPLLSEPPPTFARRHHRSPSMPPPTSACQSTTNLWLTPPPLALDATADLCFYDDLLSNYSSFEGVLYCKPHFDQLFKMAAWIKVLKVIESTLRIVNKSTDQVQTNSKVSRFFSRTREKCVACKKTVYPIEKVAVDGTSYHKACLRCSHGGCVISPSNYITHLNRLYCKHHHVKGNFSQLDKHAKIEEVPKLPVAEVVE
ncbi:hypothetical protein ACJRO7_032056 [Eucalyptus globulus]|uniref:LIM zinc-binding domain-containing protein n=1 Tax=Eucalyptus globulus TaxID=34317 RepID=A0ABD3JIP7_EUCGL